VREAGIDTVISHIKTVRALSFSGGSLSERTGLRRLRERRSALEVNAPPAQFLRDELMNSPTVHRSLLPMRIVLIAYHL
jgi:hypothetical protein